MKTRKAIWVVSAALTAVAACIFVLQLLEDALSWGWYEPDEWGTPLSIMILCVATIVVCLVVSFITWNVHMVVRGRW